MSNEHIIRAKILELFDVKDRKVTHTQGYTNLDGTFGHTRQYDVPDAYNHTVNRVCKNCNEGWMNLDVEIPVEGTLFALIRGERPVLDSNARQLLARWVYKTALVRALVEPREIPIVTQALYNDFYAVRLPSSRAAIFFAWTDYSGWPYSKFRGAITIENSTDLRHQIWVISIIVGCAAFFILFDDHEKSDFSEQLTFFGSTACRIWPALPLAAISEPRFMPRFLAQAVGILPYADAPIYPPLLTNSPIEAARARRRGLR